MGGGGHVRWSSRSSSGLHVQSVSLVPTRRTPPPLSQHGVQAAGSGVWSGIPEQNKDETVAPKEIPHALCGHPGHPHKHTHTRALHPARRVPLCCGNSSVRETLTVVNSVVNVEEHHLFVTHSRSRFPGKVTCFLRLSLEVGLGVIVPLLSFSTAAWNVLQNPS